MFPRPEHLNDEQSRCSMVSKAISPRSFSKSCGSVIFTYFHIFHMPNSSQFYPPASNPHFPMNCAISKVHPLQLSKGKSKQPSATRSRHVGSTSLHAAAPEGLDTVSIYTIIIYIYIYGDGSKPWYLVNPKIAGKWMFIPLKMYL